MTPGQRPGIRLFRFQHSLVSATENTGFPWEMMSVISQRCQFSESLNGMFTVIDPPGSAVS